MPKMHIYLCLEYVIAIMNRCRHSISEAVESRTANDTQVSMIIEDY
jgi:hypothetical protein